MTQPLFDECPYGRTLARGHFSSFFEKGVGNLYRGLHMGTHIYVYVDQYGAVGASDSQAIGKTRVEPATVLWRYGEREAAGRGAQRSGATIIG